MICDTVRHFYGIPERDLNFTIFNSQLIHMIRQIKGEREKKKGVSSLFKSISGKKKEKDCKLTKNNLSLLRC